MLIFTKNRCFWLKIGYFSRFLTKISWKSTIFMIFHDEVSCWNSIKSSILCYFSMKSHDFMRFHDEIIDFIMISSRNRRFLDDTSSNRILIYKWKSLIFIYKFDLMMKIPLIGGIFFIEDERFAWKIPHRGYFFRRSVREIPP